MKIEITLIRNGLLVSIEQGPSPSDALGQRASSGPWFAHDTVDALGRIVEAVRNHYDPMLDQLQKD